MYKYLKTLFLKVNNLVYIIKKRPELKEYRIQNRRLRIFSIKDIIDITVVATLCGS